MKISRANLVTRCKGCRAHYTIGETGDERMCDACIEDTVSYDGEYYDSDKQDILDDYHVRTNDN